ncbi:efflux RND transporter permease subunit [Limisalsivibrio acetivorans]|uniref:efflux RND transporter permease subunit n=1 Tax=Limisalsivibrio acetivorans TaxID=1304888 RepID=UPI0003B5CCF9|nr:efflux RND transporter permease subunit [Limisalsivibrio acetivorans]
MLITDAAVNRKSTIFVLMLLVIIVGVYSYVSLPRESDPDITIPYVLVVTPYEGVAPEDIESLITLPIERKLKGIKNVKEIRSTSAEGSSMITIEFTPDTNIDNAMQWVRDKVDQAKGDLPSDLEQDPQILEINLSEFPIMNVAVHGSVSEPVLKKIAEDLKDEVEGIPGVLEVILSGGREREIRVLFDHERLAAYNLSFVEILQAIQRENVNIPGGTMDIGSGKYLLRIPGEFSDPSVIDNLVLVSRNGRPIYLKDVAQVVDTYEDRESLARLNAKKAISLAIKKRTGENIIEVSDRVRLLIKEAEKRLPDAVSITINEDQSDEIRDMVGELENNILSGLILVILVLFMFLGKRNSLFVALAIPFSMLITFGVLYVLGMTLNMVVLFSLILALGMLVDNAIVIVENIYRHMTEGKSRNDAARTAATEVGWPIISSTVTTLCAFFPMLFWPDIMGEYMKFLPMTLIITLSASLFVGLVINPVICSSFMTVSKKAVKSDRDPLIIRLYEKTLVRALRMRWLAFLSAVGFLVFVAMLYGKLGHGVELFPDVEPERAYVEIKAPEGTNIERSRSLALRVESVILNEPDVLFAVTEVGVSPSGEAGANTLSNYSKVSIRFKEKDDRLESSFVVLDRMREHLSHFPGAELKIEKEEGGPPTGAPVSVEISGENVEVLSVITDKAKNMIKDIPGLVDLKDNLVKSKPEISVSVDREKATLLGLSTSDISNTVKAAMGGYKLGVYREGEDEYDITARMPEDRRMSMSDISSLLIPSSLGKPVPLSTVADVKMGSGFGSIRRIDSKRVVTITANVTGRNSNEVLKDVMQKLSNLETPAGYNIDYSGEQEEQKKASAFLSKAFLIALFLIALVLITQFNSILQAGIVLTSVILSLSGVFLGLIIMAMPFGIIMTGVGVVSLAGVVVNNAIVLIDYTNQLRQSGMELIDAVITAGRVRFRPVMLTAVTTILGLLPMAAGISFNFRDLSWEIGAESAQWWGSMAVAIIYGLAVATMLTLIVVPVLYSWAATGLFKKVAKNGKSGSDNNNLPVDME